MKFYKTILVFSFAFISLGISCCKPKKVNPVVHSPLLGEWEEQSSVWLGAPTYENRAGFSTLNVQAEMIKGLAPHVIIDMAIQDSADIPSLSADLISLGVSAQTLNDKVRFRVIPHNDIWFRDMGGIFLKNASNQLSIVDFNFNGWGYRPYTNSMMQAGFDLDETVDRSMATNLSLPTVPTQMILEGGAIESNGKGTIIVAKSVVLQRNPTMSLSAIEAELKRVLQVKKVIWVDRGVGNDVHSVIGSPFVIGGQKVYTPITTHGHTDEFVRFVNSNTILLTEVSAAEATDTIAKYSRAALLEAESILKNATDQDGKPFTIIHMPEVPTIIEEVNAGDGTYDFLASMPALNITPGSPIKCVLAASYLNYVISNGVILVAKYARADRPASLQAKDDEAKAILQAAFPTRTIIQIDVTNINIGGGGMHCISQQVPKL
jgi:agmatine deiminase